MARTATQPFASGSCTWQSVGAGFPEHVEPNSKSIERADLVTLYRLSVERSDDRFQKNRESGLTCGHIRRILGLSDGTRLIHDRMGDRPWRSSYLHLMFYTRRSFLWTWVHHVLPAGPQKSRFDSGWQGCDRLVRPFRARTDRGPCRDLFPRSLASRPVARSGKDAGIDPGRDWPN